MYVAPLAVRPVGALAAGRLVGVWLCIGLSIISTVVWSSSWVCCSWFLLQALRITAPKTIRIARTPTTMPPTAALDSPLWDPSAVLLVLEPPTGAPSVLGSTIPPTIVVAVVAVTVVVVVVEVSVLVEVVAVTVVAVVDVVVVEVSVVVECST